MFGPWRRCAGVALLDQADRGGHRLHGRPHLHVHPVQSLPAAMAPPQGLQPHHHGAELSRERTALLSGPDQRHRHHQARSCGGPGDSSSCTGTRNSGGLGHVGGGDGGTDPEPSLSDAQVNQWLPLTWTNLDSTFFREQGPLKD